MAEAEKLMAEICANAPIAVKFTKMSVTRGMQMPLEYALQLEQTLLPLLLMTQDVQEGMAAFAQKRKPTFKNA